MPRLLRDVVRASRPLSRGRLAPARTRGRDARATRGPYSSPFHLICK